MSTGLKRYLLFAGASDDPGGGWYDFRGSFEDPYEAFEAARTARPEQRGPGPGIDWWHVIDGQTGAIVAGEEGHGRSGAPPPV